jgi:hypothetical protein
MALQKKKFKDKKLLAASHRIFKIEPPARAAYQGGH